MAAILRGGLIEPITTLSPNQNLQYLTCKYLPKCFLNFLSWFSSILEVFATFLNSVLLVNVHGLKMLFAVIGKLGD